MFYAGVYLRFRLKSRLAWKAFGGYVILMGSGSLYSFDVLAFTKCSNVF